MEQLKIDLVKLLRDYNKKGWAGISSDFKRVVVWGKTLKETTKKAKSMNERVYYFPTGETYSNFVGFTGCVQCEN